MASIHDGHRERMRNKYFRMGLDAFEPHEALEMLLFFSRRQGNTNPLAHELIDRFGSVSAVLSATPEQLLQVKGIGENTAMLISMILPMYRMCMIDKNPRPEVFNGVEACGKYLQAYFKNKTDEEFVIMLFDNSLHLVSFDIISKGVTNFAPLSQRKILESIIKSNAASALIAHNHPNGTSIPSRPDAHATIGVRNLLKGFNVELLDHIVVGEDDYVSMASSKDYRDVFDDDKQKEALEALLKVKKTPKKKSTNENK